MPSEVRQTQGREEFKKKRPDAVLVSGRPEAAELDTPPSHLPPDAQDFWRASVTKLVEVGIVDRVDIPVLEQLCVQYARIRQAQRVLAQDGHFVRGSVGQLREHPAMKIEREATRLFLQMAEHYALTPIARTRLGLAELHRRSLAEELNAGLGAPKLRKRAADPDGEVIDATVVG